MKPFKYKSITKDIMNENNINERAPTINKSIPKDINQKKDLNSDWKNKTVTFEGNSNYNQKRSNPELEDPYDIVDKVKEKANYFLRIEIKR